MGTPVGGHQDAALALHASDPRKVFHGKTDRRAKAWHAWHDRGESGAGTRGRPRFGGPSLATRGSVTQACGSRAAMVLGIGAPVAIKGIPKPCLTDGIMEIVLGREIGGAFATTFGEFIVAARTSGPWHVNTGLPRRSFPFSRQHSGQFWAVWFPSWTASRSTGMPGAPRGRIAAKQLAVAPGGERSPGSGGSRLAASAISVAATNSRSWTTLAATG